MYRPWGLLDWSLDLTAPREWSFIGALGTEERSLAAWKWLRELGHRPRSKLLLINDPPSRHSEAARAALAQRRASYVASGGDEANVIEFALLDELFKINEFSDRVLKEGQPVILDITSLPKRFFFPLLKTLLLSQSVPDLILTYTSAEFYESKQPLSEDANAWAHLPGFPPSYKQCEVLIVGVGFMAESLQQHLSSITEHESIKLLVPLPATLSAVRRSWEFVYHIEAHRPSGKFENHRIDAVDMSSAFDRILSFARSNKMPPAFAPFGPKPMSAAMCLFAAQKDSAVYYPQPKIYHPTYSHGVAQVEGKPAVHAYWVKHSGVSYYSVPA